MDDKMDKIDLNDPDFYDTLNRDLDSLMASFREKKEQILFVETKAAILSVEFASMLNTLKTENLDDLKKTFQDEDKNMTEKPI